MKRLVFYLAWNHFDWEYGVVRFGIGFEGSKWPGRIWWFGFRRRITEAEIEVRRNAGLTWLKNLMHNSEKSEGP
jgi:hypothetical protein